MSKRPKWMKEKGLSKAQVSAMLQEKHLWVDRIDKLQPEFFVELVNRTTQIRINGRLDLYPFGQRWHDLKTGMRGNFPEAQRFEEFIRAKVSTAALELLVLSGVSHVEIVTDMVRSVTPDNGRLLVVLRAESGIIVVDDSEENRTRLDKFIAPMN